MSSSRACHGLESVAEISMSCCCGNLHCAYLEHNTTLISGLERDLDKAARLGQALLSRHESFVTKAQEENERLSATVDELQAKRQELQTANERIVAENRELLAQLDAINASYKSSDETVKSLEEQLRCSELEIGRLAARARRAEELEACVQDLHLERSTLKGKLDEAEAESKTTLVRWRESERKIKQLELELDKIEWESKLERERHDEVVARLQQERIVDRDLGGAEARLKGAAALHGIDAGTTNNNVVSSFVRDILKDNATLQAGIVELRELLQSSNDEIQNLRQQVMVHQPLDNAQPPDDIASSLPLSLDTPVGWHQHQHQAQAQAQASLPTPPPLKPELHVHHHYHSRSLSRRDRTPSQGRPVRRRSALHRATTPRSPAPSTPRMAPLRHVSSPDLPVPRQAQAYRNRWSSYSSAASRSTISSMPSSPKSGFDRYGSIFDRIDPSEDSSRPTSPESAAGFPSSSYTESDAWLGMKKRRLQYFNAVAESGDEAGMSPSSPIAEAEDTEQESLTPDLSKEQSQESKPSPRLLPSLSPSLLETTPRGHQEEAGEGESEEAEFRAQLPDIRPLLRHCSSQDSLVSISGMDIHIAKRPTVSLLNGANSRHFALLPSSARSISASQPVASITDVTATSSQQAFTPSAQGPAGLRLQSIAGTISTKEPSAQTRSLGRFGGWMRGRWNAGPTENGAALRSASLPVSQTAPPTKQPSQSPSMGSLPIIRKPGINQPGAIPGLWPVQKVPRQVTATFVDTDGLKAIFEE